MNKVYIVSRRVYKREYHAEPYVSEGVLTVFDTPRKATDCILKHIKSDHEFISVPNGDYEHFTKYNPYPWEALEERYVTSVEYDGENYFMSVSYTIRTYDVA